MPVSTRSNPGLFSLPLIPLQQEPPAVWSPGFSRDQCAGVSDLIIPLETAALCSLSEKQPGEGGEVTGDRWARKRVRRGRESNKVVAGGFPPTDTSERPKNSGKRWGERKEKISYFQEFSGT